MLRMIRAVIRNRVRVRVRARIGFGVRLDLGVGVRVTLLRMTRPVIWNTILIMMIL